MKEALTKAVWGVATVMMLGGPVGAASTFELGAGFASPMGNLQDYWNTGLGLNGAFMIEIMPFVSAGVSASYSTLGFDSDAIMPADAPEDFSASGGDVSIISLCAEVRGQTGAMDKAVFFGGAGLGLYMVGISDITAGVPGDMETVTFDTKNRFGGFANAGFAIPISAMIRLGARAQYNIYWIHEGGGEAGIVGGGDDETSSFLSVQALMMISFGG